MGEEIENEEHWDRVLWLCDATNAKAHDSFGHIRDEVLRKDKELLELRKKLKDIEVAREEGIPTWAKGRRAKAEAEVLELQSKLEVAEKALERMLESGCDKHHEHGIEEALAKIRNETSTTKALPGTEGER